jgi:hypothetical protein
MSVRRQRLLRARPGGRQINTRTLTGSVITRVRPPQPGLPNPCGIRCEMTDDRSTSRRVRCSLSCPTWLSRCGVGLSQNVPSGIPSPPHQLYKQARAGCLTRCRMRITVMQVFAVVCARIAVSLEPRSGSAPKRRSRTAPATHYPPRGEPWDDTHDGPPPAPAPPRSRWSRQSANRPTPRQERSAARPPPADPVPPRTTTSRARTAWAPPGTPRRRSGTPSPTACCPTSTSRRSTTPTSRRCSTRSPTAAPLPTCRPAT